jgi:hypothetical protein
VTIAILLLGQLVRHAQAQPAFQEGDYNYRGACIFYDLIEYSNISKLKSNFLPTGSISIYCVTKRPKMTKAPTSIGKSTRMLMAV